MFIECTLLNDEPIALNINQIKAIYKEDGQTAIYCECIPKPFIIKESFEDVIEAIKIFNILSERR